MIATGDAGKMGKPRVLALPRGAQLLRLAHGLTGPVDAFFVRNGTYHCTRLHKDGALGATIIARQPFKANPCHLRATSGMNGPAPRHIRQPAGFQLPPETLKLKRDTRGDSLAVWDDWPTSGSGWTYGLFYAIKVHASER
jgi:hypothetical protein